MIKMRLIALLLIIPLVLSLAACKVKQDEPKTTDAANVTDEPGKTENAYELYKASLDKLNAETNLAFDSVTEVDMSISVMGMTFNMKTSNVNSSKVIDLRMPEMQMEVHETDTTEGTGSSETTKVDVFLDKDNVYVSQDGAPYIVIGRDSAEAQSLNEILESGLNDTTEKFKEDMFKNAKVSTESDGSRKIELSLTKQQLLDVLGDNINESLAAMDEIGAENVNYDFNDVNIVLKIDSNGYFAGIILDCIMLMNMMVQGQEATSESHMSVSVKYYDIGKPITINIPEV